MMGSNILETLGVEIIAVMSPVSICMFLVVLFVYSLSHFSSAASISTATHLVYLENPSHSAAQNFEGSLLNALIFVIAIVTFLLLLLYYYNFTNFFKYYIRISAFLVLGGSMFLSIIQHFSTPMGSITFSIILFNLTIVGMLSVISRGIPILITQGYTVYDSVAVLAPTGPLKMLLELAQSRDDDLPALVYEARPMVSPNKSTRDGILEFFVGGILQSSSVEMQMSVVQERRSISSGSLEEHEFDDEEMSLLAENSRRAGKEECGYQYCTGTKLGLGDFIFYSVLVGRAAMYDLMTG